MRIVAPLFALVLLAGCAQTTTWQKAGVSDEDRQRDMVDCRRQADAQAEREMYARGGQAPIYEVDPATGQVREVFRAQGDVAHLNERTLSQQFYGRCLQARGYRQE
jgi:uncharacterized lipoprotein YajG